MVTHLATVHGLPVQRACRGVRFGRATYSRPLLDWARRDVPIIAPGPRSWQPGVAGASESVAIGFGSTGICGSTGGCGACTASSA